MKLRKAVSSIVEQAQRAIIWSYFVILSGKTPFEGPE